MDDFIVSARKYRPQVFDTVVGQESITQTLVKAIESNHLAQAFLFCGPRGVGKTTCARILARTVNAHSMGAETEDTDYSFNIFELDAASNNSVDDIRNLIDQVRIPPQIGKYKVYIVDEVHMLSQAAFNAFLKTLEEPPPYAIFILATTEKHKILPTILSRCQVFDFNRIQIPDIVKHLSEICVKENIEAEHDALHIIAEKADGALRDALSIFDQIVGFAGNKITYQDVITNLNILDYDYYFTVTDAFLKDQKSEVLITFNTILNNGFDGHNFLNGVANHFRNLLFCTSERTAAIMEVGDTIKQRYIEQSKQCDSRFLLNALSMLSDADINYKASKNQRLLVELSLLKICSLAGKLAEKKNSDSDLDFSEGSNLDASTREIPSTYEVNKIEIAEQTKTDLDQPKTEQANNQKIVAIEPESDYSRKSAPTDEKIVDSPIANLPKKEVNNFKRAGEVVKEIAPEKPNQPVITKSTATVEKDTPSAPVKPNEPVKKSGFSSKLSNAKSKGLPSLASMSADADNDRQLGSSLNAEGDTAQPLLHEDKPAREFNLAQLWNAWDEYAAMIKSEDKQSYYSTLTKNKPVMREKFKIELLVDNHVQKSDLDEDKARLLEFLREKLQNWKIQLESIIDEEERTDGDSLYDPHKKYEAMVEKNPTLEKMRKLFDLDVDHDG